VSGERRQLRRLNTALLAGAHAGQIFASGLTARQGKDPALQTRLLFNENGLALCLEKKF